MFEIGAAAERADPTTQPSALLFPVVIALQLQPAHDGPNHRFLPAALTATLAALTPSSFLTSSETGSARRVLFCSAVQMHDCHCSAILPRRLIHSPVLLIPTARETGGRMAWAESETRPNRRVDKS